MNQNGRFSLGYVQTHATQFDSGLFKLIAAQSDIDLTVYYTRPAGSKPLYDKEIQRKAGWDFDLVNGYHYISATSQGVAGRCSLIRTILRGGHDLVIVGGYARWESLVTALLGRLTGTPVGVRVDSVLLYQKSATLKSRVKGILLPLLLRLFTTAHPTGSLARQYLRHFGFEDKRLFYFPYAVNDTFLLEQQARYKPNRAELRGERNIRPSDFVVLAVVKFSEREDPMTLLRAHHYLTQEDASIHCILVGDGPLRSTMEKYIQDNNVPRIHLPGYVNYSTLPLYYTLADVFVHPARIEPWGVSVNEALVLGVPAIVADTVGAAHDLLAGDKTGLVFPVGDARALADKILVLRHNDCQRSQMATAGPSTAAAWGYQRTLTETRDALQYIRVSGLG